VPVKNESRILGRLPNPCQRAPPNGAHELDAFSESIAFNAVDMFRESGALGELDAFSESIACGAFDVFRESGVLGELDAFRNFEVFREKSEFRELEEFRELSVVRPPSGSDEPTSQPIPLLDARDRHPGALGQFIEPAFGDRIEVGVLVDVTLHD
jgi:hypothetical protein